MPLLNSLPIKHFIETCGWVGYLTRSLFLWDWTVKAATQVEALKCGVKECVAEWAFSACGLYLMFPLLCTKWVLLWRQWCSQEREGEKQVENQELPTNSLRLIPSVSPEISQQGTFGVFHLVCLYVWVGWEFLFTKLKAFLFFMETLIHICFFAPALPLLTHLGPKLSPRSYQQILSLPAFSLSLFVALL